MDRIDSAAALCVDCMDRIDLLGWIDSATAACADSAGGTAGGGDPISDKQRSIAARSCGNTQAAQAATGRVAD